MHISMTVPYDKRRLRRNLTFIVRPQVRRVRIAGVVLAALGVVEFLITPDSLVPYVFVVLGLGFMFAIGPLMVESSMRGQSRVASIETRITVGDEWLETSSALSEGCVRWAAFDRIVEAPEGWFLTFGKLQAFMIPSALMTEAQRAEFAAFVNRLPVVRR